MRKKIISLLLIFTMVVGNFMPFLHAEKEVQAAESNVSTYKFVDHEIADTNADGPNEKLSEYWKIRTKAVGQYSTFEVPVSESGVYQVTFLGHSQGYGGTSDIQIDGVTVGEIDFQVGGTVDLGNVTLFNGNHEIKFVAKEKGTNSYYQFPKELKLELKETIPAPSMYKFAEHEIADTNATGPNELTSNSGVQFWKIRTKEMDQYSMFEFPVTDDGLYQLTFTGYSQSYGGISAIQIDGVMLGEIDFYQGGTVDLGQIPLTKGTHEIKFIAKEKTGRSFYQAPVDLSLEWKNSIPAPDFIKINAENPQLEVADSEQLTVTGYVYVNDETFGYRLDNAQINYASSQPQVLDVYKDGTIKGIGVGQANVNAGVTIGDKTVTDSVYSNVAAKPLVYKFYENEIAETNADGDNVIASSGGKKFWKIRAKQLDQYSIFEFNAPYKGLYAFNLVSFFTQSYGGIVDIFIDGEKIGTYDFHKSTEKELQELNLSKGKHTFKMVSVDKSNDKAIGYYHFPAELEMSLKYIDLELETVQITAERTFLQKGESVDLNVSAILNDGTAANLSEAEVQYLSDNEQVVTVSDLGQVSAIDQGEANVSVTVTLDGITVQGSVKIEVKPPLLSEIKIHVTEALLRTGGTAVISVTEGLMNNKEQADMDSLSLSFSSEDETIATVDQSGKITAVSEGKTYIQAMAELDGVSVSERTHLYVTDQEFESVKTRSTHYTPEKVANARENIENYSWAKSEKERAVDSADKILESEFDQLWSSVLPQSVPRAGLVNKSSSRSEYSLAENEPYKIKNKDGLLLPSNDFKAYYDSGLNEKGIFNADLADRSLLVNTLYPEKPSDWGVDDGHGWTDENGNKQFFVAFYNHWNWYEIRNKLVDLRDAYLYTGDSRYANAGIVLLDRIADIYPDLDISVYSWDDGYWNSHGLLDTGKMVGSIWETNLIRSIMSSYDAFYPAMNDSDLKQGHQFLIAKATQYDLGAQKISIKGIEKNIEDGIFRQVLPGVKTAQIKGNEGMHQAALAMSAVVLDEQDGYSKAALDFLFKGGRLTKDENDNWSVTGGAVLSYLTDLVDRDGQADEASPHYNNIVAGQFLRVADILDGYDGYENADLYQNPKFKSMFYAWHPLVMLQKYTPSIGDSQKTGNPYLYLSKDRSLTAYEKYADPFMAQIVYFLNNNTTQGIHSNIFAKDPEGIAENIEKVIETEGLLNLDSSLMPGYGFAALRDGQPKVDAFGNTYSFPAMAVTANSVDYKIFSGSGTLQLEATDADQSITLQFEVGKSDQYDIEFSSFKASSYGIYEIKIDGQSVTDYNFYGNTGAGDLETLVSMHLEKGAHTISFVNKGKDPESSSYKMGIIQLRLLDEQALELKEAAKDQVDTQRGLWMYFGRNQEKGHWNKDTLNLGLHAFGLDLAPDLGYPATVSGYNGKRMYWIDETISHNTVVVDKTRQNMQWVALPHYFDDTDRVKLIDVEAPKVYPDTDLYRRTTAMIKVDEANSYAVDFFRVKGGNDHHFSFHGAKGEVTTDGLNMETQNGGSYAGADVAYGDEDYNQSVASDNYTGVGFNYMDNVSRDSNPSNMFSIDWSIEDHWGALTQEEDIHLRLTMLGELDEVAIANGYPPKGKGNPDHLKYMIANRTGENLDSIFTSVIEPYKQDRFIETVEKVDVRYQGELNTEDVRAIKLTLTNGRTDYVVSSLHKDRKYVVDNKFTFQGSFGVYSEEDKGQSYGYVNDGAQIGNVTSRMNALEGEVVDFTKELSMDNQITIKLDRLKIDPEQIKGKYIFIENDYREIEELRGIVEGHGRNAVYPIGNVQVLANDEMILEIGDVSPIRHLVDDKDLTKGFVYNFAEGARFSIPLNNFVTKKTDNNSDDQDENENQNQNQNQNENEDLEEDENGVQIKTDNKNVIEDHSNGKKINRVEIKEDTLSRAFEVLKGKTEDKQVIKIKLKREEGTEDEVDVDDQGEIDEIEFPLSAISDANKETTDAIISVESENASYDFPVNSLDTEKIAGLLNTSSDQVKITIRMEKASQQETEEITQRAQDKGSKIVSAVIDFTVEAEADGKIEEIKDFGKTYVSRSMSIDKEGIDAEQLAAVVIDAESGELYFVPGVISEVDGKTMITIKRNSNSKYAVIESNKTFTDIENHWAKGNIQKIASKLLVYGFPDGSFKPTDSITRAEFLSLLIRGLGLEKITSEDPVFTDVSPVKWYSGVVNAAVKEGIIPAENNSVFRPNEVITREEMAVMIMSAMDFTGNEVEYSEDFLDRYLDREKISLEASEEMAKAVKAEIIFGTSDTTIDPKGDATRAQAVAMLTRLLQHVEFIN